MANEQLAEDVPQSRPVVLYVEDEENDVLLFQIALKRLDGGDLLMTVRDGQEAMDYLSGQGAYRDHTRFPKPCVVLADLNMPRVSGLELLKWIRSHSEAEIRELPVLIMSSSEHPADRQRAAELQVSEYVVKPTDIMEFRTLAAHVKEHWIDTHCRRA